MSTEIELVRDYMGRGDFSSDDLGVASSMLEDETPLRSDWTAQVVCGRLRNHPPGGSSGGPVGLSPPLR